MYVVGTCSAISFGIVFFRVCFFESNPKVGCMYRCLKEQSLAGVRRAPELKRLRCKNDDVGVQPSIRGEERAP